MGFKLMFNLDGWDFEPEWPFLSSFFLDYDSRLFFQRALPLVCRRFFLKFFVSFISEEMVEGNSTHSFFTLFFKNLFNAISCALLYFHL
jgi:hypothetical protein